MTHQTYFKDIKNHVQTEMLAEFTGKDGRKEKLIDAERWQANKPLEGQAELCEN